MQYRICNRCVMDTSAEEITFDEKGQCSFCTQAFKSIVSVSGENLYVQSIKNSRSKYDALIGLSGGVDSSFALVQAVKYGLRPLCFTVDTGYNKPEADENIMRLVETLKVPFIRYTIDLQKFKELQSAFIRSGVPNIEIPTDHILMAVSYELAVKYGIKTILSGGNVASESIMPPSWGHNARDLKHIKAIYAHFSKKPLTGLPLISLWKWNWYRWFKGVQVLYLLDYINYNRTEAEKLLIKDYGFQSTGEKHEENYFTWWFQNFYLFEKFGIDKRKAHYSSLICSGQMTRKEALEKLAENPIYPQLGIEERVMKYAKHPHRYYPQDRWYERIARVVRYLKYVDT